MSEWSELAECLVEIDLAIEDIDSWATRDEDVEELKRLEALRDELQGALARHKVSARLRRRIRAYEHASEPRRATVDPRD